MGIGVAARSGMQVLKKPSPREAGSERKRTKARSRSSEEARRKKVLVTPLSGYDKKVSVCLETRQLMLRSCHDVDAEDLHRF